MAMLVVGKGDGRRDNPAFWVFFFGFFSAEEGGCCLRTLGDGILQAFASGDLWSPTWELDRMHVISVEE